MSDHISEADAKEFYRGFAFGNQSPDNVWFGVLAGMLFGRGR
jgi:hypothetical protein